MDSILWIKNFGLQEIFNYIITPSLAIYGIIRVKKSKIYFVEKQNIKLYDDITKNIEGLSISYNDSIIQNNLIYVKYTIYINSVNDIKSDDIDKELTIYSHDYESQWKYFKITNSSIDDNLTYTISGNFISFDKFLLKNNDYITFVGLIESTDDKVSLKFRIYNILKSSVNIKTEDYYNSIFKLIISSVSFFILSFSYFYLDSSVDDLNKKYTTNEVYNYKVNYFLKNHKIDIDKKIEQTEFYIQKQNNAFNNNINLRLDSIKNVYLNDPTDKNQIELLKKNIFSLNKFNPYKNNYSLIKNKSILELENLLKDSLKIDTTFYEINDSIKVKYINNSSIKKSDNTLLNILIPISILYIIYFSYKVYTLWRILKKFKE